MPNVIEKLKNIGVSDELDFSLKRKVQLSNLLFPITSFCTFFILVALFLMDKKMESMLNTALFSSLLILSCVFNWIGWYVFARNVFLAVIAIGICSSAFFAGESLHIETILIPAIGVPFVLFTRSELRYSLIWCFVFASTYFYMDHLYTSIVPMDPLSVEEAELLNDVIVLILFVWMSSVFLLIRNENIEREELIRSALEEELSLKENLEKNYEKLLNSQEALINKEKERILAQENVASALEKADFSSRFLAKMSHELRTPINGITGNVELLSKKNDLGKENQEFLNRISNSSKILLGVVNDVLDLSRIKEGELELNPKTVSLKKVVNNSIDLYKSFTEEKDIQISLDIEEGVPEYILIDDSRLSQILNNLLSNSIKLTTQGAIRVRIGKHVNNKLRIEVQNEGKGISIQEQEFLFQEYSGSGLGLSICKSLVELLGGEIGVNSEENKGSEFWFTFAYEVKEKLPLEIDNQVAKVELGLNVLLVDDMEINLSLAKAMLEEYGCSVTTAKNGFETIEKYEVGKFNLVLIDINMPDKNGDVVVRELKSRFKCDSVFIGLSANAMAGEKEEYLSKGLDDYLSKPITFEKLYACLSTWFDSSGLPIKTLDESFDGNVGFLIDMDRVTENARLMGGEMIYSRFIDKFLTQNKNLWQEIELCHTENRMEDYCLKLHTLSGIASSMGAAGYYEILHAAYSSAKEGCLVSEEEMKVIGFSTKEVEECFIEIKNTWKLKRES